MSVGIQMGNAFGNYLIRQSITPGSVAANTTASQFFTVPGLLTGDLVFVNPPFPLTTGVGMVGWRVSGVNQLEIVFGNFTAGGLTPGSGNYLILVMRPEKNTQATIISD